MQRRSLGAKGTDLFRTTCVTYGACRRARGDLPILQLVGDAGGLRLGDLLIDGQAVDSHLEGVLSREQLQPQFANLSPVMSEVAVGDALER